MYIAILILVPVLIILFYPFWRSSKRLSPAGEASVLNEEMINRSLEREGLLQRLSDLEIDYAQGKLIQSDYERLKLTQEHSLLTLLDRPAPTATVGHGSFAGRVVPFSVSRSLPLMLGIGVWIVAVAIGVSSFIHGKITRDQIAASESNSAGGPMAGGPDPVKMVARLEEKLRGNPNDLQSQMMLGRSYMVLQRWADAQKTWKKVLELDERNPAAHSSLGEVMLRSNPPGDKGVAKEALVHFDQALISTPQDPSLLWARGIALVTLGRFTEADEAWTTAYGGVTLGSEEAEMIKTALEALRSGKIQSSE